MTFKKSTSLAIIALLASVWIGCSSKEDREKYDAYYGKGKQAREEAALVAIKNQEKIAVPAAAPVSTAPAADTTAAAADSEESATTTNPAAATEVGAASTAEAAPKKKAVPAEVSALLSKHACLACHQPYEKVIGPAYADVAKKKYSAEKIVELVHSPKPENWPGYPPMAPMAHVPKGDIVIIANWINSL
ncbi:c-type cytochrome [Dyadobacter tibetensis]|uniref:c-type cytochrome n=1 Tax=Dyadobacter tibetensis TaxID=1211851 RepID=UPI000470EED3|nr:hypothetical protein [Dyadobacter tibetensis]